MQNSAASDRRIGRSVLHYQFPEYQFPVYQWPDVGSGEPEPEPDEEVERAINQCRRGAPITVD